MFQRTGIWLAVICALAASALVCFFGVAAASHEEVDQENGVRQLRKCFSAAMTMEDRCRNLEKAVANPKSEALLEDMKLELANVYEQLGRTEAAITIYREVAMETHATRFDMNLFFRGAIVFAWEKLMHEYYGSSPDLSGEHATLALARLYLRGGAEAGAWALLEQLRLKYPQGDRIAADLRAINLAKDVVFSQYSGFVKSTGWLESMFYNHSTNQQLFCRKWLFYRKLGEVVRFETANSIERVSKGCLHSSLTQAQ